MARRHHLKLTIFLLVALFLSISYLVSPNSHSDSWSDVDHADLIAKGEAAALFDLDDLPQGILEGESIAPKLENATLKAELGRATWKFLHTMAARFPEKPTPDDRRTLETFIHLFGRLYPCGDCARHFRGILAKYPPQTSSRNAAAGWLCFAHNIVNERLEKPVFDCNNIGNFYDCGCGDEDGKKKEEAEVGVDKISIELEKD